MAANKERLNERYRLRYYRRKRWIDKWKLAKGCSECGYSHHPAALDFDHIDPGDKSFLIPRHLSRGNLRKLFREIRKCRIVCANCHRVHSHNQWHSGITTKFMEKVVSV